MHMSCDPMRATEKEKKTRRRRVNLAKFAAQQDKATAFSCSLVPSGSRSEPSLSSCSIMCKLRVW